MNLNEKNIREICSRPFGREMVDEMMTFVGTDADRFAILIELAMDPDQDMARRAGWPLSYLIEKNHWLIQPYFAPVLKAVKDASHNGVRRNFIRALSFVKIPEEFQGPYADLCFDLLNDPVEAIAVRIFAMEILWNITQSYPELAPELAMVIREHLPQGSAGYKSKSRKILKKLEKLSPGV